MTNEENELLLKDLCVRLPYGVKIKYHYKRENNVIDEVRELSFGDVETLRYTNEYPQDYWCEISWKPYLRPMSSMTEMEKQRFDLVSMNRVVPDGFGEDVQMYSVKCIDWLNAHYFDYRGLISKGLALEAPEGMYKTK